MILNEYEYVLKETVWSLLYHINHIKTVFHMHDKCIRNKLKKQKSLNKEISLKWGSKMLLDNDIN